MLYDWVYEISWLVNAILNGQVIEDREPHLDKADMLEKYKVLLGSLGIGLSRAKLATNRASERATSNFSLSMLGGGSWRLSEWQGSCGDGQQNRLELLCAYIICAKDIRSRRLRSVEVHGQHAPTRFLCLFLCVCSGPQA